MQNARGPFYISFMLFIITVVKLLITCTFPYSVHRYLGYLKCVALINRVAEKYLYINHYCHIQEFLGKWESHLPFPCNKTQWSIYHTGKQIHSQERVTSPGALAGLSPGVLPWPKWSSQSIHNPFMVSYAQMMSRTNCAIFRNKNILIFLNNAKWFWRHVSMQQQQIVTDRIIEELQKY